MFKTLNILDLNFANISSENIIKQIYSKVTSNDKFIISYLNVHICNYAKSFPGFSELIKQFSVIHPDGIGIYIASKILYGKNGLIERSTGTDLYFDLFRNHRMFKFFLVGGIKDCADRIKHKLNNTVCTFEVNIVGSIYKLSNYEKDLAYINNSGADVLLVALGTPFQEKWIIENKDKINVPVIIAVGSGLDFLADVKKRAPLWMRKIGLEWFYRLFQEPKRLWKRYIIGIPVFMFHIFLQKAKLMLKKD